MRIPDGWSQIPLGEVLQLEYGKPLPDADRAANGKYPVYGANGEKDRTNKCYWEKPSIIVGRKGSAGEVNLTEPRFWPLDVTYFVTFDDKKHDLRFLYNLLVSLDLPSLAKGVKPGINRNEVYDLLVCVPPLPEQRRIVAILDEAFAAIATAKANTEQNLANAREVFESHLKSGFDRIRAKSKEVRLGDVVDRLTNGFVGPTRGIYHESGIPYLLARHVKSNVLTFDGQTYISSSFNLKAKKSILKAGDVLLVQSGHIGHSAVVPPEHEGHNCHAMIVITPRPGSLDGHYLSAIFGSPQLQAHFQSIRTGSTVPHLNCGDVIEMLIPIPSITDQRSFARELAAVRTQTQHLESLAQRKLAALDALKASLLHHAFTGQLTGRPAPSRQEHANA